MNKKERSWRINIIFEFLMRKKAEMVFEKRKNK